MSNTDKTCYKLTLSPVEIKIEVCKELSPTVRALYTKSPKWFNGGEAGLLRYCYGLGAARTLMRDKLCEQIKLIYDFAEQESIDL